MTAIDPHEIMRELGFDGHYRGSVLAQNRGKAVWRISGDGVTFALRILRADDHEVARRERQAMDHARAAGRRVPQVLATATWHKRPVMLLSWCNGQTLREAIRSRPWSAFRLGMVCGQEQARLHGPPGPPALGSESWITRFGAVDAELHARLERVASPRHALLHLDCHPDNVLVAGGAVTGLVDWTNAWTGDARADLARTWSMLTRPAGGDARAHLAALLWRAAAFGWHRGYEQIAGPQRDMLLFRIWAATGLLQTSRAEAARDGTTSDLSTLRHRLARMRARARLSPAEDGPS